MKRLVKLQLRNIFHNKLFYICLGIVLLISPIASFISQILLPQTQPTKVLPQIMSFLSSEIGIVGKIFIALFCCFEFSNETTKNIIAKGYTRVQLLFSKYIGSLIGVFSIYIITSLVILILFVKNGIGYDSSMIYPFINSIISIIAFTIFFSTMSFIIESSGIAIIACLFVPTAVTLVLTFVDANLKLNIGNYWIDNVSSKFIQSPTFTNLCLSILGYLIYVIIFAIVGIQLSKRKEIK